MSRLEDKLKRRRGRPAVPSEFVETSTVGTGIAPTSLLEQLQQRICQMEKRAPKRDTSSTSETAASQTVPHHPASPKTSGTELRYDLLPGSAVETVRGTAWIHVERYRDYHHGSEAVMEYRSIAGSMEVLAQDTRLAGADPQKALFLDTETTGLSGGTGTLPFLIGLGFFDGDEFVVEHLLCREPAEEPAQLTLLAQRMSVADHLVTFNGKSFDVPLVNTRFIVNRIPNPGAGLPHLDLLPVARRIFKRRIEKRSLQHLEKEILGFHRHGDIPGSLIPQVYRKWLAGDNADDLLTVLAHNSLDILALAALGGWLDRMYRYPEAVEHAADHLGYAAAAYRCGHVPHGEAHLNRVQQVSDTMDRQAALHMAARQKKREKRFDDARDIWNALLDKWPDDALAHLNLAKYYEHRNKQFSTALCHARKTKEIEGQEGMEKRCARLIHKQERRRR